MFPNVRPRWIVAATAISLFVLGGGWYSLKPARKTTVEVSLTANVCEKGGSVCYSFAVRDAKVTVIAGGNQVAHGATDNAGVVTLTVPGAAYVEVIAESPVIDGGKVSHHAFVSQGGGLSVSFSKAMSARLSPWGQ